MVQGQDAESAESKEKPNFRFLRFFIFQVMDIFVFKCPQFSMNFHDNSENKNKKNLKIDLSFDSTYWASSIKTGSKLMGEGSAISLVGKYTQKKFAKKKVYSSDFDDFFCSDTFQNIVTHVPACRSLMK